MATYSEVGGPDVREVPESRWRKDYLVDPWGRQFIDDLVAANRFKTFLLIHGKDVPFGVREGLADLSQQHQAAIMRFVHEEKRPWSLRSLLPWARRSSSQ